MRTTNECCPTVTATATTVVNTESDCAKAAKRTRGHALQRAVICVVAPRRDDLYALAYVCWAQRMPRRSSVRPVGRVAFRSGAEIRPLTHVITITEWLTQRLLTLTVPNAFMCGSEECIQYSYLSLLFTPRHKRWKYVHNCISHLEVAATVVHRVQRITPPRNTVFVFGLSSWTANCRWYEKWALSVWTRLSQVYFFRCLLSSFVEHSLAKCELYTFFIGNR